METKKVVFACEDSFELKAIAVLIQKASSFRSSIWLNCDGRRANAKSLLGVMSLRVENGMEIEVSAEGADEEKALETVVSYLSKPAF